MSIAECVPLLKAKPAPEIDDYYWVFVHDGELGDTDSIRWDLYDEGFDLLWDSARSRRQAIHYMEMFYSEYAKFEPIPAPISFRESCDFVNQNRRHHVAPQGMKFTVAVSNGRKIIGVLIAGRPVSRRRDHGLTLEVTRLCVLRAYKHLCSKLYAAAYRIARELRYRSVITYTLEEEAGASLRASGFHLMDISPGGSWSCRSRERDDKHPTGRKKFWILPIHTVGEHKNLKGRCNG